MSETAFTAWLNEVMPDIPGAPPQALVTNAIRNAAIEFCERSWVYRATLDAVAISAGVADYELEAPDGTKVAMVLRAWYSGVEITPKSADELAKLYENWKTVTGTPRHFTHDDPEVILLVPMPEASEQSALVTYVALKPSRAATGICTPIYEKYLETIASGAKARLFAMKRKPWSDGQLAAYHGGLFDMGVGKAKVDADKGHARTRRRVKAHYF